MNFTFVDIAIAFTIGYILGALGMWIVQRTRRETDYREMPPTQIAAVPSPTFEGLGDEDRTRIQTRPNLVIAKAPKPTNFDEQDSYGQDTEGSIELVESLPETPDREDVEDTEDFDDSSLPGIDLPLEDFPELTDNAVLEDALGSDDTMPFIRPANQNLDE